MRFLKSLLEVFFITTEKFRNQLEKEPLHSMQQVINFNNHIKSVNKNFIWKVIDVFSETVYTSFVHVLHSMVKILRMKFDYQNNWRGILGGWVFIFLLRIKKILCVSVSKFRLLLVWKSFSSNSLRYLNVDAEIN